MEKATAQVGFPKFWEVETPVEVETSNGRMAYYPKAKKLQISRPAWLDENGETRNGKTVTLSIGRFIGNEQMIDLLNMVIAELMSERNEI